MLNLDEETFAFIDAQGDKWELSRADAAVRVLRLASYNADICNAPAPPREEPEEDADAD